MSFHGHRLTRSAEGGWSITDIGDSNQFVPVAPEGEPVLNQVPTPNTIRRGDEQTALATLQSRIKAPRNSDCTPSEQEGLRAHLHVPIDVPTRNSVRRSLEWTELATIQGRIKDLRKGECNRSDIEALRAYFCVLVEKETKFKFAETSSAISKNSPNTFRDDTDVVSEIQEYVDETMKKTQQRSRSDMRSDTADSGVQEMLYKVISLIDSHVEASKLREYSETGGVEL